MEDREGDGGVGEVARMVEENEDWKLDVVVCARLQE